MTTTRISVLTLNAWGNRHLDRRGPILTDCFRRFLPDILCLQEAGEQVQTIAKVALSGHEISSTTAGEIAILWQRDRFRCLGQGVEALPQLQESRNLVWAQLHDTAVGRSFTVATAHFTWPGHADEVAGHGSPRIAQAEATVAFLQSRSAAGPVIFTGDLNEAIHPRRILREAGFTDAFTCLGMPCEPTRPAPPWDTRPAEVDDWIVSSADLRPTAAFVVHHQLDGYPPSDHWPVFSEFAWKRDPA